MCPAVCPVVCPACLILAACFDLKDHRIPDFLWWIMAADSLFIPLMISEGTYYAPLYGTLHIGADLYAGQETFTLSGAFDCLAVIAIQEKIMSGFYGRADSHAFSCCEVFFFFLGCGIIGHIIHMSAALFLLSADQLFRRNIGKNLKLKEPVAFVPYICISFFLTLFIIKSFHLSVLYMV